MDRRQAVLEAAERRGAALAARDEAALRALLHRCFVWTSHLGERFDLNSYIRSNLTTGMQWYSQRLTDSHVILVGNVAVLTCLVTDVVDAGHGPATYKMPMTQTWIDDGAGWHCLAGHAGPRTDDRFGLR